MAKYIVNAAVEDFALGEVVDIDARLFEDLIQGKFLSPIDDFGHRLTTEGGELLVLNSTTEEQRREREAEQVIDLTEPEPDAEG